MSVVTVTAQRPPTPATPAPPTAPTGGGDRGESLVGGKLLDIQGLRAVAVLLVVANHLTGWPGGGFVGVDVFFVISGFVITATLVKARGARPTLGRYVLEFYRRRIRRLIPASLVTLAATIGVAFTLFDAARAREITVDGVWAGLFSANWHFIAQDTDYFAAAGPASPFEHFWSLSVEEQFYLAWPLMLFAALGSGAVAVGRHRPVIHRRALVVVLVVTAASLTWAWVQTADSPVVAYFSTFTRAWELAVGAALALVLPRVRGRVRHAAALSWVGLGVIAASALVVDAGTPFPAPGALGPVVGAALVIVAATARTAGVNPLLRTPSAVRLGDASYAVYLVHLPAIVIVTELLPDGGVYRVLAAGLVVAGASVLLHLLVERPFLQRHGQRTSHLRQGRADVVVAALGVVLVGCSAVTLWPGSGESLAQKARTVDAALAAAQQARATGTATDASPGPASASIQTSLRAALAEQQWPALDPDVAAESARQPVPSGLLTCGDIVLRSAPECSFGARGATHTAYLVGDSTAMAYAQALRTVVLELPGWRIRIAGAYGCSFSSVVFTDADQDDVDGCRQHNDAVVAEIGRVQPDLVFVTNTYTARRAADTGVELSDTEWTDALSAQLDRLPSTTRVALLEPAPLGPDPRSCYDADSSPVACAYRVTATHHSRGAAEQALATARGLTYVATEQWFCDTGTGYCPVFAGSVVIKHDTVHVAYAYDDVIAPAARESFDQQDLFR